MEFEASKWIIIFYPLALILHIKKTTLQGRGKQKKIIFFTLPRLINDTSATEQQQKNY